MPRSGEKYGEREFFLITTYPHIANFETVMNRKNIDLEYTSFLPFLSRNKSKGLEEKFFLFHCLYFIHGSCLLSSVSLNKHTCSLFLSLSDLFFHISFTCSLYLFLLSFVSFSFIFCFISLFTSTKQSTLKGNLKSFFITPRTCLIFFFAFFFKRERRRNLL